MEDFMNFDLLDKSGYTLLSYAIEGGSLEIIRFVVLCGGKNYAQDDENLDAITEEVLINAKLEACENLQKWVEEVYKVTGGMRTPLAITELIVEYVPPSSFLDK